LHAAGILSLLKEPEEEVKVFGLNKLDQLIDEFWAEIAASVTSM
jgi:26S proteasome regulatory subunit N2